MTRGEGKGKKARCRVFFSCSRAGAFGGSALRAKGSHRQAEIDREGFQIRKRLSVGKDGIGKLKGEKKHSPEEAIGV